MEHIIDIRGATVRYGSHAVVKGLDMCIDRGSFVSLIGPNGAGKSTILKAITKNVDLDSGDIRLDGKSINDISYREKAQIVGFVPQEFSVDYDFGVYDIVAMGRNPYSRMLRGFDEGDVRAVEEAMLKTDTLKYKDKKFNNLSGGEKQRVIIARALAQQPKILILDEATSNLDIHHQLDVLELIYRLNREDGMTVLAVMHDLNMAARFSDKLILLSDGAIVCQGRPEEVLREDVLKGVYDMEVVARDSRLLSCREVVPLRVSQTGQARDVAVHVICGGGTGEYILQRLYSEGYRLSAGILSRQDTDYELCVSLGIDCASSAPFSEFCSQSIAENEEYMRRADAIIITDVAIGTGNLKNIQMAAKITDKPVIILHSADRDFVKGACDALVDRMRAKGNVTYAMNLKALFDRLKDI